MGARLVGDDVCLEPHPLKLGQRVGCVGDEPDAEWAALALRRPAPGDRVLEVVGLLVEVAGLDPPSQVAGVDLDAEADATVHRDRQRLRPAHAAQARRQRDRARQRPAEAAPGDLREALVGPLDDPLGPDVDPRPGRHLAVHRQALGLEPAKLVPVVPLADQVRVGDQDARGPLVGAEDPNRLARLDEQRLVVAQLAQRPDDRVEGIPGTRRAPPASIDDQLVGVLGHLGIEVVHQHPHGRLLLPAPAGELCAPRGTDRARAAHRSTPIASSTAPMSSPLATRRSIASSSGAR